MRRWWPVAMVVVAGLVALVWDGRTSGGPTASGTAAAEAWAGLDAQSRCDRALELVTFPARWPLTCRWRADGEALSGQSFPPPVGPPPYDNPHAEVYVARTQSPEELASAVAHEFGHMHLTREPNFVPEWLAARNLPPATPSEVWTEDYAEVFAVLFAPPADRWRAPTARPSPGALTDLKARFFSN